jgi:hypothetical protein
MRAYRRFLMPVLVANDRHIEATTRQSLSRGEHIEGGYAVLSGSEGMLLYVQTGRGANGTTSIARLLRVAAGLGARYILLHRHAARLPGLPWHESLNDA